MLDYKTKINVDFLSRLLVRRENMSFPEDRTLEEIQASVACEQKYVVMCYPVNKPLREIMEAFYENQKESRKSLAERVQRGHDRDYEWGNKESREFYD